MDANANIAAAAVGAVVALTATYVMKRLEKANTDQEQALAEGKAHQHGYDRGWYEGRNELAREWSETATPQIFAPAE